jgi:hypothetical protein
MAIVPDGPIVPPAGAIVPDGPILPPAPPPEPGALESLGRGLLQGGTLGFGDEIAGAIQHLFAGKDYTQARDESRANNASAQQAHPYLYGAGELGGGIATAMVPGLGATGSLAKAAGSAALAGGLTGIGASGGKTAGDIAKDAAEGAFVGGATGGLVHGITSKVGSLLERSPEMRDQQTLKLLSQGEGKAGASWAKTRGMVNDPNVTDAINASSPHPDTGKVITLHDIASKPAEEVQPVIRSRIAALGDQLDKIYDKADQKSGGVAVSDLVKHYDDQIAKLSTSPGNLPMINGLRDARNDVLNSWAPKLAEALKTEEAANPTVKAALLREYDVKVPSRDVRAYATTLQDRGSDTIDRLNPGVASQAKKLLGSTTRDFVNAHVENVLGADDASALRALNAKTTSLYRIGDVVAARAEKEAAGKMSGKGLVSDVTHKMGLLAAIPQMATNPVHAAMTVAAPYALDHLAAAPRMATVAAVKSNQLLQQLVSSAQRGNPWATAQPSLPT